MNIDSSAEGDVIRIRYLVTLVGSDSSEQPISFSGITTNHKFPYIKMLNTPPTPTSSVTEPEEIHELMPIQVFTIIFAVVLGIITCYSAWCACRFYRDVRYSTESQRVWPVGHRFFDGVAPDSLPPRTNNKNMLPA